MIEDNFKYGFNQVLLRSERKRTLILVVIFSIALLFRVINRLFPGMDTETASIESVPALWIFPLIIVLFETTGFIYITRRIKRKQFETPLVLQYLNTGIEVCLPSILIYYIAVHYPAYNVMQSPMVSVYFLFIILSTLRLNFTLSALCGLLASLSSVAFSVLLYHQFSSADAARSFILLFSGIAAGFVGKQIKSGIDNSLKEIRKRQKVENLFGQQISKEVADKMMETEGNIESKRMQVAVMFIDIRNFTRFTIDKTPEEIVKYQNAFLNVVLNVIARHKGIVNQILGDGCMVTFGAPVILNNPSQNAVYAAKELLISIDDAVQKKELYPTRIGIGIHTGEAVTGNIGTAVRKQYSITGSVVILASRIEQLNKEYQSQILISDKVKESVQEDRLSMAEFIDKANLKGWPEPVGIYKVA